MGLIDYVIIGVVVLLLGLIAGYILKTRKKGRKCIGCPQSCDCGSCSGTCGKK